MTVAGTEVRLDGFTSVTYPFVAGIAGDRWGHPEGSHHRPTVIPFESAAALHFVLRGTPDDEFPGGKWATIQHHEGLIDVAAQRLRGDETRKENR